MQQRRLGPFSVSAIGLGCMNFCHAYGEPVPDEQAGRVLLGALDAGVTLFDTAALYGFGASETLVGKYLRPHRSRFTLASKCGMQGVDVAGDGKLARVIDGRPETLRATCEDSLRRLQTDVIDLYYLHRWDKKVPIEESVGALGDLVRQGKIRSIGLSEVSAATLRRAHAEHPIAALQTEYSLWTRNPEIAGGFVLAADTVVSVGRRILPKAEIHDEAADCLRLLSGRSHRVHTAVCLITPKGAIRERLVETKVRFKRLSREEIDAYLGSGEWRDKAGGYAVQGFAGTFVVKLVGSYSNVVGLPLYETVSLLSGEAYPVRAGWLGGE